MEKEKAFAKYRIYKLAEDERIESFDCGDADLNDFALNDAQPYRKEKLAVTYTLLDKEDIHCVAAFFCLLNDRISMADFDTKSEYNRFRKRFFVVDNKTGCRFLTVDAYADAVPFYLKNGFVPLNEDDKDDDTRLLYFDLNDVSGE
ncbi:MAG: GNAT family N-acetyltransferase [Bacteroidales bacterium]|nr:GNAT family N-acetyltransferase [Bacteroidales bacterium]MBR6930435.1 GNAT family N-acetyltransferase [Bacteroidales bacterium]